MVMGPTHAMSGAAGWLLVAPALSAAAATPLSPEEVLLGAVVTSGAALLPDIDTPGSTVARSFGPLTWLVAKAVNAAAAGWYNLTKRAGEPFRTDGHRTLTHTLVGMLLLAAGTGVLCGLGGKNATLGVLFFLIGLAIRGLMADWARRQGWLLVTAAAAGATFAAHQLLPGGNYWWLSLSVLVGTVLHGLGDAITKEGTPWLAPVPIGRKAWHEWTLPSFLSIRAGGAAEVLLFSALTLLTIAAVAATLLGGWTPILDMVTDLTS